jgi:hypothetical protein
VAAALPLIIAGVSAAGAIQSAIASSNAAKFNASIANRNAQLATLNAQEQERRQRRLGRKRLGALRANIGASGVALTGTPLDLLADSAAQEELDALTIRHQGKLKSTSLNLQSGLLKTQAKNELISGGLKAGSALLLGASKQSAG